jgi:hypothetical protein
MSTSTTQAQLFATEYAKDTAREMLDTIKGTKTKAERVTRIALAISMPHQIGFILGLAPLQWGTLREVLESATLILGAVLIPVAVDYLILICIQVLSARGAADVSKKLAFWGMLFPIGVSGTVNVLAPAPALIRVLFGVAVVLIPLAEGIRAMTRPDFGKIERMETEIAGQVTAIVEDEDVAPIRVVRTPTEQLKAARRRAGYDKMTPAQKRAWTRAYKPRTPRAPDAVDVIEEYANDEPVSPAVYAGR